MLDLDRELVEKLGITDRTEPDMERKREFVEEQISQLQVMSWRMRVDYMVMSASTPSGDVEAEEKASKLKSFERELSKYVEALVSFNKILDELNAEGN